MMRVTPHEPGAALAATLRFATEHGVPVVPRGARTGLTGGANAVDGGIVLSLAAMDRLLDVDVAGRAAEPRQGAAGQRTRSAAAQTTGT